MQHVDLPDKSLKYQNQVGGYWKRVSCPGNRTFCSGLSVELLACNVSMIYAVNWPRQLHLYTHHALDILLERVHDVISYHLHFSNLNISGTNADVENGKHVFYSFMEF